MIRIIKNMIFFIALITLTSCNTMKSSNDAENKKIATAKINTQLGMTYLEQHNIQRAKRKFLLALDEAPNIPETWYGMAYFLEATGDKEQAKKYYLKSVTLAPERGDVQNNFGTFLCRAGAYDEAIQHFQLAAKDINYVDTSAAYENAGLCAMKMPDKKLAWHYFNKAIEQDPNRATSYIELAKLSYQEENYQRSKNYLEQFLNLSTPTKESFDLSDKLDKKLGDKYFMGAV